MKKLYEEYFYIPEDGKIRDKVMVVRVAVTVAVMLACLFAMTFSAYAYFSHSVTSDSNVIKSADYDLTVIVKNDADPSTELTPSAPRTYTFDGTNAGIYTVTLTKAGKAKTGFCVIEVTVGGNVTRYYTNQIGLINGVEKNEFKFTIEATAIPAGGSVTVKFIPHWGTSSYYGSYDPSKNYIDGVSTNKIDVTVVSVGMDDDTDTTETTDVTTETTTPETTTAPAETTLPVETEAVTTKAVTEPVSEPETEAATTAAEIVYTVKSGDKLWEIAAKYGVSLESIVAYNNIENPDKIIIDQKLRIPPVGWTIPTETTSAPEANE